MIKFLPLQSISESFEPLLSETIQRVVSSGWYIQGKENHAFEDDFAAYIGVRYCIGVGNGLDALTLSLMAMKEKFGWDNDDEVIVPDMTFIATAEAIVHAGLRPVFADVDENALLTVEKAKQVLTSKTRLILPVHLYGHPAPMDSLCQWAENKGLYVLEDAAQSHGAQVAGRRTGAWGKMSAFSFYPGKNLGALGDGGAVLTDDEDLAHRVRVLANYGAEKKYHHVALGYNSRLDEIQAAILRLKLKRLDEDNAVRQHIASLYSNHIANPLVKVPYRGDTKNSVFHIYPIRCKFRDELQKYLLEKQVETIIHYPFAVSDQCAFKALFRKVDSCTPESFAWASEELSLPISPVMTDDEALYVCEVINNFNNSRI